MGDPESEKPSRKFLRVWKDFAQNDKIFPGKCPDSLDSFRTVWKVSGQSGKFPESLGFFLDNPEGFNQTEKFLDSLESLWTIGKVYNQFANTRGTGCFL